MPFFTTASLPSKIAFILLFPAFAIHVVGYFTMYWMRLNVVSGNVDLVVGLWKMKNCTADPCLDSDMPDKYMTAMMYITRGLMAVPIPLILIGLILSLFYVMSPRARAQSVAGWITGILFVSAGFTIAGIVIWAINLPSQYYVSWSLGMTIIAGALCVISATLMIKDIRDVDYEGVKNRKARKRLKKKQEKERLERLDDVDLYNDRY